MFHSSTPPTKLLRLTSVYVGVHLLFPSCLCLTHMEIEIYNPKTQLLEMTLGKYPVVRRSGRMMENDILIGVQLGYTCHISRQIKFRNIMFPSFSYVAQNSIPTSVVPSVKQNRIRSSQTKRAQPDFYPRVG